MICRNKADVTAMAKMSMDRTTALRPSSSPTLLALFGKQRLKSEGLACSPELSKMENVCLCCWLLASPSSVEP